MELFGRTHSLDDLEMRIGDISQVAGLKQYQFLDGKAKGMKAVDVKTGSGLNFTVISDKCMDIAHFEYKGIPFAHISKSGLVAPLYYETRDDEWLWSFHGGLITTCGFVQAGTACDYKGKKFGLHGRAANIPAEQMRAYELKQKNDIKLIVTGRVREAAMEQHSLSLNRRISTKVGSNQVIIDDQIKNEDYNATPFMLIYHMNIGYPIFSEDSQLYMPVKKSIPFSDSFPDSINALSTYNTFGPPDVKTNTQVYFHELEERDIMHVCIVNKRLKLGLGIAYNTKNLPYFAQARIQKATDYYTVLEPANCYPVGRQRFEKDYGLSYLEGRQMIKNRMIIDVLDGEDQIEIYKSRCVV